MAFVRRVVTGSGATAVQVVAKDHGRLRVIKHVGSAHTPVELELFLQRGREILAEGQGELDLGVPPAAAGADLVDSPARQGTLLGESTEGKVPGRPAAAAGPGPRVVGMSSDVLWETLRAAYRVLGFGVVDSQVFEQMVLARLVEPTSMRDVGRVLAELGVAAPHRATLHRHLRRVVDENMRDQIAAKCFQHAATHGDVSLVLYDVTTLYFEAEHEDELRKVGFSKERRVDPQVVVGLLVDREGFPLEIGCYEGNHAETRTIVPIVKQFQARHGLADMVVVADAGMLSTANLTALDEAGLKFIVGSRQVKAPGDLATHFHWHGDAFTDGQLVDTITPRSTRSAGSSKPRPVRAEPVWDPEQHPGSWRAVWQYSRKRAVRDGKTLTAQENRARAVIDGDKPVKATRFVKTTPGGRSLDEKALERARRLVGLKGYVTNIDAATMSPSEVIGKYHDLWHVEQSFRMSKTDLQARPMFHHTRDAIEAHLTIVFTALAVARFIQNTTGYSIRHVIRTLRALRAAVIEAGNAQQKIPAQLTPEATDIITAITRPGH
jgi:hypothetical protein